jgi:hypothetical protein
MATTKTLTEWVPALAKEIHGAKYTSNHDMITHLEAQRFARMMGMKWGKTMNAYEVDELRNVMLAFYADKRANV